MLLHYMRAHRGNMLSAFLIYAIPWTSATDCTCSCTPRWYLEIPRATVIYIVLCHAKKWDLVSQFVLMRNYARSELKWCDHVLFFLLYRGPMKHHYDLIITVTHIISSSCSYPPLHLINFTNACTASSTRAITCIFPLSLSNSFYFCHSEKLFIYSILLLVFTYIMS